YLGNYSPPPPGVQLVSLGAGYGMGFELAPQLLPAPSPTQPLTVTTGTAKTITAPVPSGTSTLDAERARFRAVLFFLDDYIAQLDRARISNVELSYLEKAAVGHEARRARAARLAANRVGVLTTAGWSRNDLGVLEEMASQGGLPADQDMGMINKAGGGLKRAADRLRAEWTPLLAAVRARYAVSGPSTALVSSPLSPSAVIGPTLKVTTDASPGAPPPPPPPPPAPEDPRELAPVVPDPLLPSPTPGEGPEVLTPDYRGLFERFIRGYPGCATIPQPPDCGARFNEFLRAEGIAPPPTLPPQTYPGAPPPSDLVIGPGKRWEVADLFRTPDGFFMVPPIVWIGGAVVVGYFLLRPKRPKANPRRRRRRRRR
ncbi:MAG TPA: hypothetical protein VIY27_15155, partial [Myxococcota bacterium]